MKKEIAKAIKALLIDMAINDTLPMDMTQLDEAKLEKVIAKKLKPLKEAVSLIKTVKTSCEEGVDGTWDCSTEEGKEGFNDMITLLDEATDKITP